MSERRYSDEEVAAIFERAAVTENTAPTLPAESRGTTLAALQDIGREVGISPESIALAAQSLDQAGHPAAQRFVGLPIGVGRSVELDRKLSDPEWEELVAHLRTTFRARGVVRYDGPFRQWTNGNLQALLEPTSTGHRLRLQTMKSDSRALMSGGMVLTAGAAATLVVVALTGGLGDPGPFRGIALMAAAGIALFTAGAVRLSGWARLRRAQFEEVIARLSRRS
ncbi:MAG TPA: hypothetical protein VL241_09870 [Gemmatimonadales bacterium]|nr:hypothetical protein [Gemmatimonadales bacterium]